MSLVARVVLLIALALLPGISVQLYTEFRLRETRQQEVMDSALRLATQAAAAYSRIAEGTRQLLVTLSLLPAIQHPDDPDCTHLLADLRQQFPDFERIGILDRAGLMRCGSDTNTLRSDAAAPYFRRAISSGGFATGLRRAGSGLPEILQFGYPVHINGAFSGVVFAELSLRRLAENLRHGQPLPASASLVLTDASGTILMRLPDDPNHVGSKIAATDNARMNATPVGAFIRRGVDGAEQIFGHVPLQLSDERLLLGVGLDRVAAFAEFNEATRSALIIIAISSIVALLVAGLAAHGFLVAPIRRLVGASERWTKGEYSYQLRLREHRSELGRLGVSLNHMASTCQELLRRKELLFKEINHRIFNSLQVLSSAISLQRARLATPEAREQNDRVRQRVVSTGLVLRRIYAADQLEEVQLDRFLQDLCSDLSRVLLPPHMKDRMTVTTADAVVPIDWIVPLASVVAELTVALARRLRADSERRLINLTLESHPDMTLQLSVVGTGEFTEEIHENDGSLRAEIVRLLLDQLNATLETQSGADWVRFTMHLPRPPRPLKRPDL